MTATGDTHRDVRLVRGPVRVAAVDPFPPEAGAECLFLGRTRAEAHPEHGALHRLDYHAYEEMALQRLEACADAALDRYECRFVRVHHALGTVPVGDASVLVQTLAAYGVTKFATKSVPGALLVGGGLLAKVIFDRSTSRRSSRRKGERALRKQSKGETAV